MADQELPSQAPLKQSPSNGSNGNDAPTAAPASPTATNGSVQPRLWPAVVVLVAQWFAILVPALREPGSLGHFMSMVFVPLAATAAMIAWWLLLSRVPWRDRLLGTIGFVLLIIACGFLIHPSLRGGILFYTIPTLLTVTITALVIFAPFAWPRRRRMTVVSILVTAAIWMLWRSDGMDGSMNTDFAWRWATTAEEAFLESTAAQANAAGTSAATALPVPATAQNGDWPEFRGLQRDGVVRNASFSRDWKTHPPRELWRRAVGPGWSSFAVIEPFLFTQEQRGSLEVVVCYRSDTGQQCWVNEVESRYDDSTASSGVGPRATPTFSDGQLFTMGATGTVLCLDASTGKAIWSRNIVQDVGAEVQLWGCSSSPLVVDDVVVVFAGGKEGQSVIGYDRSDGTILWSAGEGLLSYSSPHLASAGGRTVVLMLTEIGLEVYDPASGDIVWRYDWPIKGMRIVQPQVVDHDHLILAEDYNGARMLRVFRESSNWTSAELWTSRSLKPYFNDFVYHKGFCYGFDGKILACVDASDGKRRWKGGRYGFGQLLLLTDMDALLVLSETGEVVLLEATPEKHTELGRFPAIAGKTWNHPVIAHGKLFVRNGQEAACFELPLD